MKKKSTRHQVNKFYSILIQSFIQLLFETATASDLEKVQVKYITLPGWKKSIAKTRKFSDLPMEAQNYVHKIEELLEVPVRWIGVGADRLSIIQCS